ncbi:MAG: L,D-transpeptidase [Solirubrobacterales bacterium]
MRPTSPARGRLGGLIVLLTLALAGVGAPHHLGTAASVARASAVPAVLPEVERLSDERRITYWAFARQREGIRAAPSALSPPFAQLRLITELGTPEVYLVLRRWSEDGRSWLEVRVPMRPNGRVGWVPEDALDVLNVTHRSLTINLRRRRANLFERGRPIWSAPVGIGKGGTPTPRGHFYVRERLPLSRPGGVYGLFAFGTSAYSPGLSDWPGGGVVGIHGTNQPQLIPGTVSHGCVRVRNSDIRGLRRLMGLGTPVWIR